MILLQMKINLYEIAMMGAALGFLFGLIPLILGFVRKERSYAVFGFLGSIIGGGILGIFLSLPIVAIFTWLILRKSQNDSVKTAAAIETPIAVKVENPKNY